MKADKLWVYNEISDEKVERIAKEAGISELMARIFINRGIIDCGYIEKFLNPSVNDIHDPFLLSDMDKATERIISAIEKKEKILIYGDYDVDGVTSTSILYDFLFRQGAVIDFFIPDRMEEGYGLTKRAIDKLKNSETALIITVDCGITSIDEVNYVKENGMDIIITDHHRCLSVLPKAYAVINPCRPDSQYPFKFLAGVGVVYKLISALCKKMKLKELQLDYLDLVALGTVADVVPLIDENRVIAKLGIHKIERTLNVGLKALLDGSGLTDKPINTIGIGYVIAPRINVAGRVGDASRAVKLFTTADEIEAIRIVEELNEENKYRQDLEAEICRQVIEAIESEDFYKDNKVLVVAGDGWHHGIIGIVASKITERYYKPCVLISNEDGTGKGSGRSIEGFNLFEALNHCRDLLEKYGGHELAAGLSINMENIDNFRRMINLYAEEHLTEKELIPKIKIDVSIKKHEITLDNVKELEKLAPFGAGNPGPVFSYNDFKISEIRTVGEDKHLKLKLGDTGLNVDAIGFNMGSLINIFESSDMLDVACLLEINTWNSIDRVQLNLKDIRLGKEAIMRNNYYYSLDKCLNCNTLGEKTNDVLFLELNNLNTDEDFLQLVEDMAKSSKKLAVLGNSFDSVNNLTKLFQKLSIGIKKEFKICYTECSEIKELNVIINPIPGNIDFSKFDKVLFYGDWVSKKYFTELLKNVDKGKTILYKDEKRAGFKIDDIVPERSDLVAVYQYLKSNLNAKVPFDDLFILSKKISSSYKIYINYFKLKKCIEILEELKLLKQQNVEGSEFVIRTLPEIKEKANIENSILYRKLQLLKKGG